MRRKGMKFWLCIDDTDDETKEIGTGQIAKSIYEELKSRGCSMKWSVTRHQLFLSPEINYTSHNSAMCMEGDANISADEIWKVAEEILSAKRSQISNPGICLYIPQEDSRENLLVEFGRQAKTKVLTIQQALDTAKETGGVRLCAPSGNGNGQIGALAGVGLRVSGNDGTFRGNVKINDTDKIYSLDEMKALLKVEAVYDPFGNVLPEDARLCAKEHVKLAYRNYERKAVARCREDGIYELFSKASDYEESKNIGRNVRENCESFEWDNDSGECNSNREGACENCLHRRLTAQGLVCMLEQ
jgi:hypothetical protein